MIETHSPHLPAILRPVEPLLLFFDLCGLFI